MLAQEAEALTKTVGSKVITEAIQGFSNSTDWRISAVIQPLCIYLILPCCSAP